MVTNGHTYIHTYIHTYKIHTYVTSIVKYFRPYSSLRSRRPKIIILTFKNTLKFISASLALKWTILLNILGNIGVKLPHSENGNLTPRSERSERSGVRLYTDDFKKIPSVCPSVCLLVPFFLQNHWTDFNQTLYVYSYTPKERFETLWPPRLSSKWGHGGRKLPKH